MQLVGPEGTPYVGGWFNVELKFTEGFPGQQPSACFLTKIWHPNVHHSSGKVCLGLGTGAYGRSDVCSVACVLTGLQMLLANPNPDSALNEGAAAEMVFYAEDFEKSARDWTARYAM